MYTAAIIPARYGSSRLPGKPLKLIAGRPMIWWVYRRLCKAGKIDEILVATDDGRIMDVCRRYGIPCLMTSSSHATAAERLQEVAQTVKADFYLQINGDEPLIDTGIVSAAVPDVVPSDREFGVNIITRITSASELMDPSNIKVVFDTRGKALYMSRAPIPYPYLTSAFDYYKHVGVIGYNRQMLDFYAVSHPGNLEQIEGIDTLRFLDYGKELQFILVEECRSLSVDTPADLEKVRQVMERKGADCADRSEYETDV